MGESEIKYFHEWLHESQTRYTYFLLAAAASGIALVVNQTDESALSRSMIPLGAGVLSWAISFIAGCLRVSYVNATMYANAAFFTGQRETESAETLRTMQTSANRANVLGHVQFLLLVMGAVLYLTWHVLEMLGRSVSE